MVGVAERVDSVDYLKMMGMIQMDLALEDSVLAAVTCYHPHVLHMNKKDQVVRDYISWKYCLVTVF